MRAIFLDIETTGLDPVRHRPIDVAFQIRDLGTGKCIGEYQSLIKLPRKEWENSDHRRLIHHISRSSIIWNEACKKSEHIWKRFADPVTHAILAHHGGRSMGSPVAPKSREAWILHLCDGISARVYDADTLDVLDRD